MKHTTKFLAISLHCKRSQSKYGSAQYEECIHQLQLLAQEANHLADTIYREQQRLKEKENNE